MCAFHYCIIFFKLLLYNSTVSVIQAYYVACIVATILCCRSINTALCVYSYLLCYMLFYFNYVYLTKF